MGLTKAFVDQHIEHWGQILGGSGYPYRAKWPEHLFHHSPLENVVKILREGILCSRVDPRNKKAKDIAGAGVIDTRDMAHEFVRLYFRPRTPTQFNIEGVRKLAECARFGKEAHAPVLYMLVLDSRSVLTLQETCFSDRNMQIGQVIPGRDANYFSNIPFWKVFHEGAFGGDQSIKAHRCAEVLAPSPLALDDCLRWIYCRSEAEKKTLQYSLGAAAKKWSPYMIVSDDLRVFQKEFVFVNEVFLANDGVVFRLNPRKDSQTVEMRIQCWNSKGQQLLQQHFTNLSPIPPNAKYWRSAVRLQNGAYRVRIELEQHLAFEAALSLGPVLL